MTEEEKELEGKENIEEEEILEDVVEEEEELVEEDGDVSDLPDSPIGDLPQPEPVEEKVKIQTDGKPFNELSNLEKIKFASAQNGVETLEPNKSCKKCHGTGIVSVRQIEDPTYGLTSGTEGTSGLIEEIPNPCRCIFKKHDIPKMFTGKVPLTTQMQKLQEKRLRKIQVLLSPKVAEEKKRIAEKKKAKKKARKKLKKKHNKKR